MKVKEVMKKDLIKIKKGTSYREVAKIIKEAGISGAPVVDENNQLIGIVSEKDVFKTIFPNYSEFYENPEIYTNLEEKEKAISDLKDKKVEEFMTKEVIFLSPEDPLLKAAALIIAYGIHRLPVVDEGKLVGIISRRDIYKNIFERYLNL